MDRSEGPSRNQKRNEAKQAALRHDRSSGGFYTAREKSSVADERGVSRRSSAAAPAMRLEKEFGKQARRILSDPGTASVGGMRISLYNRSASTPSKH